MMPHARQVVLGSQVGCIFGAVQQNRLAGGGADGPGTGEGLSEERIHQRGFTGTSGAAHNHGEWSIQAASTRQNIVIKLFIGRTNTFTG